MRRTYRYDKATDRMVEVGAAPRRFSGMDLNMVDAYAANPIKSPVDGRVIDSRAKLRQHNAELGVADVGNDSAFTRPGPASAPIVPDERSIVDDIKRSIQEAPNTRGGSRHDWQF